MMHQTEQNIPCWHKSRKDYGTLLRVQIIRHLEVSKENMYIQMLEGLHRDEAEVLVYAKDKILHQKYKGLSHEVVKTGLVGILTM